jgi:hypothetical protein
VGTILDDEFVIQMDDTPPFSWIRQTPNRFMSCDLGRKIDYISVKAKGNSFLIAEMVRDVLGEGRIKVDQTFSLSSLQDNCIISYSGQVKEAIHAVENSHEKGIVLASGGVIKNIARNRGWDYIPLPKGYPTRFLFPEVFGCLLSLLGKRIEIQDLEEFIDRNSPSEITDNNQAKKFALHILSSYTSIVFDELSEGLANEFKSMFQVNSGIVFNLRSEKFPTSEEVEQAVSFSSNSHSRNRNVIAGLRFGDFPYDCSTVDGYVKNILTGYFASLYLGILRSRDIELLDRELE